MEKQKKVKKTKSDSLQEGGGTTTTTEVLSDTESTKEEKEKKHNHALDAKERTGHTSKNTVIIKSKGQEEHTNLPNKKHKKKKHKRKEVNEEPGNNLATLSQSSGSSVSEQTYSDDLLINSKKQEKKEIFYSPKKKKKKRDRNIENEEAGFSLTEYPIKTSDGDFGIPIRKSRQKGSNSTNANIQEKKEPSQSTEGKDKNKKRNQDLHNKEFTKESDDISAISDNKYNSHLQRRKKKKKKNDKELHNEDIIEDAPSNPDEGATIPTQRSRQVNANSDNEYNAHLPHRKKRKRKYDEHFHTEEVTENATRQPEEGSAIPTQRSKQVTVNSDNAHLLQHRKKKKRNRNLHKNTEYTIIQPENNPAISLDLFLEGGYEEFPLVQLHDFGMVVISKDNVAKLRLKGMQIQNGRWTKVEDKILKENMLKFCEEVNFYESEKLVFPRLYEQETEALVELINEKQMYHKIGCGIHRPLRNIYYRCRKLFDTNNYKGNFTEEEVKIVVRLQKKYGNKWTKIGRLIDRNGDSVNSSVRFGRTNRTVGAWTEEERGQLIAAVKEFVEGETGSEAWYYNIPWESVSKKVPTRESRQCRGEWLAILSGLALGTTTPEVDNWNKADNVKLIERIIEMNIHDEGEIDWLALMPEFEKAVSPQKLRFRWHIIKSNYVPRHNYKTLDEILDYVAEEVLPRLKTKLNRSKGRKRKKNQNKNVEPTSVEFVEDNSESESD